jgi:hypothetical protein
MKFESAFFAFLQRFFKKYLFPAFLIIFDQLLFDQIFYFLWLFPTKYFFIELKLKIILILSTLSQGSSLSAASLQG